MAKISYIFLVLALIIGVAWARPDVDLCTVDLAGNNRVRSTFRPRDIINLCILAYRGDLNTNVSACVAKLSAVKTLGYRVGVEDAEYACGLIGDMVKKYIAQN